MNPRAQWATYVVYLLIAVPATVFMVYAIGGYALALLVPVLAYLAFLLVRWAVGRAARRRDG